MQIHITEFMTKQNLKKENNRLNENNPFYDVLKLSKLPNKAQNRMLIGGQLFEKQISHKP